MLDVSQIISQSVYPVQNTSGVCLPAFALKIFFYLPLLKVWSWLNLGATIFRGRLIFEDFR